jgi:hypothetical protein
MSMIVLRYPDPGTAKQIASRAAPKSKKEAQASPVQVELVIRADRAGRRHVADPSQGVKAWAKSDLISWGCSVWPSVPSPVPSAAVACTAW